MKHQFIILFLVLVFASCKQDKKTDIQQADNSAVKSVKTYNYNQLEPLLNKDDGKTHVINFWATWCKPCVEELPAFEKLNATYRDKNVKVLLVSLDFTDQVETELLPFIKENNIQSEVVLFDDPNQNVWINKIDENWSGSLPATLIYNKNTRKFFEKPLNYQTLELELKPFIK